MKKIRKYCILKMICTKTKSFQNSIFKALQLS